MCVWKSLSVHLLISLSTQRNLWNSTLFNQSKPNCSRGKTHPNISRKFYKCLLLSDLPPSLWMMAVPLSRPSCILFLGIFCSMVHLVFYPSPSKLSKAEVNIDFDDSGDSITATATIRVKAHYTFIFFLGAILGDSWKIWSWTCFQAGMLQPSDFYFQIW